MGRLVLVIAFSAVFAALGAPASTVAPAGSRHVAFTLRDGEWTAVSSVPVAAWSAALLPTGKVLLFQSGLPAVLWDAKTQEFRPTASPFTNLFCAGLALLGDARLLAVGGHAGDGGQAVRGLKSAQVFDPWNERWSRLPDMVGGERWYPAALTLADGRVLVASGTHAGRLNDVVEVLDPQHSTWEIVGRASLPLYPWATVLGRETVLFYGPQPQLGWLSYPDAPSIQFNPARGRSRHGGGGLLLDARAGTVLVLGGGNPPTDSAEIVDGWSGRRDAAPPLRRARHSPNAVWLPDGRILVIGGNSRGHVDEERGAEGDILEAELFDPQEGLWSPAGRTRHGHGYHSTALLLPDGSVMAAGPRRTLEIYRPWYTFAERRPQVLEAPGEVRSGQVFLVRVDRTDEIAKVVMIRAGSLTHSLNTDQRFLEVGFEPASESELLIHAPGDGGLAPPGYYLLFVVTAGRVPSEGRFLWIR